MSQIAAPAASPAGAPQLRRRHPVWHRVLIVLVLAIGAAAAYLVTIDRSFITDLDHGVGLPSDDPSAAPDQASCLKKYPQAS